MKKAGIIDLFGVLIMAEGENTSVIEAAKEFKERGGKIFILSNSDVTLAPRYIEGFSFITELFDKFYYSGQTGFIKPDPRAFELILKENDLLPEECIYFDDSAKNVVAAASLGIESYLYESPEQVREKIL